MRLAIIVVILAWQAVRHLSRQAEVLALSAAVILLNPPLHRHDALRIFVGAGLVGLAVLEARREDRENGDAA